MEHCHICNKDFEGFLVAHLSSAHPRGAPSGATIDWWVIPLLVIVVAVAGLLSFLFMIIGPSLSFVD